MSEEEREQDVWTSGNRGETRREPPSSCAGSVRGPARRPVGLGQSEQGEESGNQLTAGLGAAELALGAIHPRLRQRSDPSQSSFAKGHAGGSVPKCAKGGNRKSSWEAAAEISGDTPIPPTRVLVVEMLRNNLFLRIAFWMWGAEKG